MIMGFLRKEENREREKMRVGFLRKERHPETRVRVMAMVAEYYDIELFYFTPERVNVKAKTINGLFLEGGEFVEMETPYPDIIDDYSHFETEYAELYEELSKRSLLTFVTLGGKLNIYRILQSSKYSIITKPYKDINLDEYLEEHKTLILKPNRGNKGKNIYKLWRDEKDRYCLQIHDEVTHYKKNEFLSKYHDMFTRLYIIQPYIKSITSAGSPLNMRVLMIRGKDGDWELIKMTPRVGIAGTVAENLGLGSGIAYVNDFFPIEFGEDWKKVHNEIVRLARTCANTLQKQYTKLIPALGYDVGVDRDRNNAPKIFEVNVYPGLRPFEMLTLEPKINFYKHLYMNFDKFHDLQQNGV